METLPTKPSRSNTPTKVDPLAAALSVVCPLICGRGISPPELDYVRQRVERQPPDVLLEAIEWLGDHAERVGNPIAVILDRCAAIRKSRDQYAEANRLTAELIEHRKTRSEGGGL